jgi:hypothetical protein
MRTLFLLALVVSSAAGQCTSDAGLLGSGLRAWTCDSTLGGQIDYSTGAAPGTGCTPSCAHPDAIMECDDETSCATLFATCNTETNQWVPSTTNNGVERPTYVCKAPCVEGPPASLITHLNQSASCLGSSRRDLEQADLPVRGWGTYVRTCTNTLVCDNGYSLKSGSKQVQTQGVLNWPVCTDGEWASPQDTLPSMYNDAEIMPECVRK